MSKSNLFGSSFTIGLLCALLFLVMWRYVSLHQELIECYREQLRDLVHIDTAD